MSGLNLSVKLSDINDFLAPDTACILDEVDLIKPALDGAGTVSAADCLSCSGCVTAAEVMLAETSNLAAFNKLLALSLSDNEYIVISLSPVVESALQIEFNISKFALYEMLNAYLYKYGVTGVVEEDLASEIHKHLSSLNPSQKISTQCPGVVLFSEKNGNPENIQKLKQGPTREVIQSLLVKRFFSEQCVIRRRWNIFEPAWLDTIRSAYYRRGKGNNIYSVVITECNDKKLEQFRPEFTAGGRSVIDLVLSANEFLRFLILVKADSYIRRQTDIEPRHLLFSMMLLKQLGFQYSLTNSTWFIGNCMDGSDTYNTRKVTNNADIIYTPDSNCSVRPFRLASGYRNLQNILTSGTYNSSSNLYLFACPQGCLNGGGLTDISKKPDFLSKIKLELSHSHRVIPLNTPKLVAYAARNGCDFTEFNFIFKPISNSKFNW